MPHHSIDKMVSKKTAHHHSIGVAWRGRPVPPGFMSIKWWGISADLNSQGDAEIVDVLMENEGP